MKQQNQHSTYPSRDLNGQNQYEHIHDSPHHLSFQTKPKLNESFKSLSGDSNDRQPMYKFSGAQQYRHPDHVIRTSRKTERYSNSGKESIKLIQ